jgi:hypothetical protein
VTKEKGFIALTPGVQSYKTVFFVTAVLAKQSRAILFTVKYILRTGLYHPLDGIMNPKYMLLHFLTTIFFLQKEGNSIYQG